MSAERDNYLSRRGFLKFSFSVVGAIVAPDSVLRWVDQVTKEKVEPFPFINQKNQSQCAIASMTMLFASFLERKGESSNLDKLYGQVLETTKKITRREISPTSSGVYGNEIKEILKEFCVKFNCELIENQRPWNLNKLSRLVELNGPAIVDINVNYLPHNDSEYEPNHWVVAIRIEEVDSKSYINIADPFRSKEKLPYLPKPKKEPEGLIFKDDRTILIPWNTFCRSAGNVFFQLLPKTLTNQSKQDSTLPDIDLLSKLPAK